MSCHAGVLAHLWIEPLENWAGQPEPQSQARNSPASASPWSPWTVGELPGEFEFLQCQEARPKPGAPRTTTPEGEQLPLPALFGVSLR